VRGAAAPGCRIWYEFDKNFRLIAAFAGGGEFRRAHARGSIRLEKMHILLARKNRQSFRKSDAW
jgi:hypothetical protein